jgi:hypothetical protein
MSSPKDIYGNGEKVRRDCQEIILGFLTIPDEY